MAIASINEQLLRAVGVGIALFDGKTGNLQFCNDVFSEWFDDAGPGVSIQTLFPELDLTEYRRGWSPFGRAQLPPQSPDFGPGANRLSSDGRR